MLKKLKKYIGIEFDKDITGFIKSYILNELDFEKVELYLGEERERQRYKINKRNGEEVG